MSESQADAGTAAVPAGAPTAATAFNPEIEFDDGDEDSDAGAGAVVDTDANAEPDGSVDETSDSDGPLRGGYFPCYRTFREQWFWKEKPWDQAHFFMELLLRANWKARQAKVGGDIIDIGRGMLPTSISKLAEDTGRDRKTIRNWIRLLAKGGEISVQNKGQHGIVITVCKYETYALNTGSSGQRSGQKGGRRSPRR